MKYWRFEEGSDDQSRGLYVLPPFWVELQGVLRTKVDPLNLTPIQLPCLIMHVYWYKREKKISMKNT